MTDFSRDLEQIIAGVDSENQVRVECQIIGLYRSTSYGAIIDTGFSGGLVLPQVIAVNIGLETIGAGNVTLADGAIKTLPMYICKIKIGDVTQDADTLVMGNDVLIGMNVLDQFKLCVDGPKGAVSIEGAERAQRAIESPIQSPIQNQQYNQLVSTLRSLTGRSQQ